jgi:hypothetical protein
MTTEPVSASTSPTAAQIHLNSLPPSTISVQISDLPVFGKSLSGIYKKVDFLDNDKTASVTIQSPMDKVQAVKNAATGGHLEFDVDGILQTHLDVDIAASKPGVATVRVESPLIPQLPFRNPASSLVPPAAHALKVAHIRSSSGGSQNSPTAAHISLSTFPPTAVSVQIQDLPVLGNALSGIYTKVETDFDTTVPAAVTIESPIDKVAAIKAIASSGHLEFDVDGIIKTHIDVDVATDTAGSATVRLASPLIPALPFQNSASF